MSFRTRSHRVGWIALALSLLASLLLADGALAKKKKKKSPLPISVANDGMDHAACGSSFDPCRSITRGIARAHELRRPRVILGPGIYGDLNQDGDSFDAGEDAEPVQVDGVSVSSAGGASQTILKVVDTRLVTNSGLVRVGQGGALAGLTIAGTSTKTGLRVRHGGSVRDVVLHGNRTGAHVEAGGFLRGGLALKNMHGIELSGGTVIESFAVANSAGFVITRAGSRIADCQALRNGGVGFYAGAPDSAVSGSLALANRGPGFQVRGDRVELTGNEAVGNVGIGMLLESRDSVLRDAFVAANRSSGVLLSRFSTGTDVDRLRAVGNGVNGLEYDSSSATVSRSAFYSNDFCQVRSPSSNAGLTLSSVYAGDTSRCRITPFQFADTRSEQQALAIPAPKKKKGKKKKAPRPATTSPWPLRP